MEWFLNKGEDFIKNHFYKWYGFLVSSILLATFLLMFYALLPQDKVRFLWYAYGMVSVEIIFLCYWLFVTFWVNKCKKNKTGLILAVYADSNEVEQNLKRDFIDTIKKTLSDTKIHDVFDVIVVKNHLVPKYNSLSTINKLHAKIKGHIYIYGETKKRKNGDDEYFLFLNGFVAHRPVAKQVSDNLAKDFISTLPQSVNFKEEFAFQGFSISASVVLKSVKYVVGIASFISGNPLLATRLHEDLKNELQTTSNKLPSDIAILKKLNSQLAEEYSILSRYYFVSSDIVKTREFLDKALYLDPNCYSGLILESNFAFVVDNDPKKSLGFLRKCRSVSNDNTWRFNEAFLYFWLGNYPSALKQCEKLKKANFSADRDVAQEVVDFNQNLLQRVKDKPILHFWLAFNYYFKLNNLPMALQHAELFLVEANTDKNYLKLIDKVNGWLVSIKLEGKWK